ncbi:MAG: nucleotidyltransferase domain-containing protein [Phycisphaerales bacterium]|nr:nucleotidyltransferase domain-containing protein [Phycisphaerales bacterium]
MPDFQSLNERAKELRCLYAIESVVSERTQSPVRAFERILSEIPAGWQDAGATGACIEYLGRSFSAKNFNPNAHTISTSIRLWNNEVGHLTVSRMGGFPDSAQPFLREEEQLLRRIAARLGEFLEWKHAEMLGQLPSPGTTHWAWRQRLAEALADATDTERFGVNKIYIGGSTARGDAGPASDIDLYILCDGTEAQQNQLAIWLDGWSRCLTEIALQQTGQHFPCGILNVQWLVNEPSVWHRPELQELKLRAHAPHRSTSSLQHTDAELGPTENQGPCI